MKRVIIFILSFLIVLTSLFSNRIYLQAAGNKEYIIVIDPGHGGENMGAMYNNVIEKELTLRVAYSMKRELEKYNNVKVYLTRKSDQDMELDERAQFAKEKKADILLALHFNMSETHLNSGCEMWISSQGILHTRANEFASVENTLLKDLGLSKSMTNTRMNELNQDYYGVIREASIRQIPACIIEHCYLDCPEEYQFYDTPQALEQLGKLDATAVAMTYHLQSDELGVDYSKIKKNDIKLPKRVTENDVTGPSYVGIEPVKYDVKTNMLKLNVNVMEPDSQIIEYEYSLNSGDSYGNALPFWGIDNKAEIEVPVVSGGKLVIRVGNSNNLHMISEVIDLQPYYQEYENALIQQKKLEEEQNELAEEELLQDYFTSINKIWWVEDDDLNTHRTIIVIGGALGAIISMILLAIKAIIKIRVKQVNS